MFFKYKAVGKLLLLLYFQITPTVCHLKAPCVCASPTQGKQKINLKKPKYHFMVSFWKAQRLDKYFVNSVEVPICHC